MHRRLFLSRSLCLALSVAVANLGCASTEVDEHKTPHGAPQAIAVHTTYVDTTGTEHLVGGISCTLHGPGGKQLTATTDGKEPLVFDEGVEAGAWELTLNAKGIEPVRAKFELHERRWANVRVKVTGDEKEQPQAKGPPPKSDPPKHDEGGTQTAAAVGDGVAFFFKAVGTVVLCVTIVGLLLVVVAID